jgi:DnaJ-class molecular chaperone
MNNRYEIVQCPDCEGKGKKLIRHHVSGLTFYKTWVSPSKYVCVRCKGNGVLKVLLKDIASLEDKIGE